MEQKSSTVRLTGVVAVIVIAGLVALVLAFYNRVFISTVPVMLRADRTGLLMGPGNSVTLHGIKVGEVSSVAEFDGGAQLRLDIDPDQIRWLPANVTAEIVPTTLFGTKYVSFELPDRPLGPRLAPGATIANKDVTVEVNDVFESLVGVLQSINPAKLSATLSTLAQTLQGRGDRIAELAAVTGRYLEKVEPELPTLQRDLAAAADVTNLYGDVSPDLLRILDNATFTSSTLVAEAPALDAFLLDVTALGTTGREVLAQNQEGLQSSLALLRPTTGLLQKYSPALTCLIQGLDTLNTLLSDVVGGTSPGLNINMSFTPAGGSYKSPRDLPEVRADNGPNCHGLPTLTPEEIPPPETHFDTGADPYPAEHNRPIVGGPPLAELLFGPVQPAEGEDR